MMDLALEVNTTHNANKALFGADTLNCINIYNVSGNDHDIHTHDDSDIYRQKNDRYNLLARLCATKCVMQHASFLPSLTTFPTSVGEFLDTSASSHMHCRGREAFPDVGESPEMLLGFIAHIFLN